MKNHSTQIPGRTAFQEAKRIIATHPSFATAIDSHYEPEHNSYMKRQFRWCSQLDHKPTNQELQTYRLADCILNHNHN